MTNKEAIKNIKEHCYFANLTPQAKEALDMAIEALKQKSTTTNNLGVDCIRRDKAIKALDYDIECFEFKQGVSKHMDDIAKLLNTIYETQVNNIIALPAVTPQEPRWIGVDTPQESYTLQQVPRWVPVSERLPEVIEDGVHVVEEYIVTVTYKGKFEGIDLATYVYEDGYIDGKWNTYNDWIEDKSEYYHVITWMPLPTPYDPQESER